MEELNEWILDAEVRLWDRIGPHIRHDTAARRLGLRQVD